MVPRIPNLKGPEGDAYPNLMSSRLLQNRQLGSAQIPDVIGQMQQYARREYIIFSDDEMAFAEVIRLTPPEALKDLELAVARSPYFRLWYSNSAIRIYELLGSHERRVPHVALRPAGGL